MSTHKQTPTNDSSNPTSTASGAAAQELTSSSATSQTITDSTVVVKYLQNNPDFFVHNPDVLVGLSVAHTESGEAHSLIERQVDVLRTRLAQYEERFAQIVHAARDNEALQERVHRLVVQLAGLKESLIVSQTVELELKKLFDIEHVTLHVFNPVVAKKVPASDTANDHDVVQTHLADLISCGSHVGNEALPEQVVSYLFGDDGEAVESYALVPLRVDEQLTGLAALGASDAARFEPGKATTYLDRIADIISITFARVTSSQSQTN